MKVVSTKAVTIELTHDEANVLYEIANYGSQVKECIANQSASETLAIQIDKLLDTLFGLLETEGFTGVENDEAKG